MKVFFDASVLVPVVSDQLTNHAAALASFVSHSEVREMAFTSAHALAECYATLTALPLPRRISGPEALRLIEANFVKRLTLIALNASETVKAIQLAAGLGRTSGQIYDAIHVVAAQKAACTRIYTYNLAHFRPLARGMEVTTP
jgi:predicted nucleic acid-binding protein